MTAIIGYASMALEGTYGEFSQKIKKVLENILFSGERLVKFVNDILNVTRIEAGKIELFFEKVKIEDLISSVFEELKMKAKEKNLYFKWEKPEIPLPELNLDKDKIRQVILNI